MKRFIVLALVLLAESACSTSGGSLEGSQSHFVCESRVDCEKLGTGYECMAGFCRLETAAVDPPSTTPEAGTPDAAVLAAKALTYVGRWHVDRDLDMDAHDAFMILGQNTGRACVADGKSALRFELSPEDDGVRIGPYDYGAGDMLRTSPDASHLQRTTVEKGMTYVTQYVRFEGTLPEWCSEQLALVASE